MDLCAELDACIALASKIDKRLSELDHSHNHSVSKFVFMRSRMITSPVPEVPSPHANEHQERPVQVGQNHLSPEEHSCCMNEGGCIYCA